MQMHARKVATIVAAILALLVLLAMVAVAQSVVTPEELTFLQDVDTGEVVPAVRQVTIECGGRWTSSVDVPWL